MPQVINGKEIASQIKEELISQVTKRRSSGWSACLTVIQVGNDPASSVYVRNKQRTCEQIGIQSKLISLSDTTTQEDLLHVITQLNQDDMVQGILVQLPLPKHIDESAVIEAIDPKKDVDGFHPMNVGKLWLGEDTYLSCTPAGIIELLKRSNLNIEGQHCVIIGRSNIVGKPMAALLLRENATVTICHSKTQNLKEVCKTADILIVAMGVPQFVDASYVKEGAVVIDVGIHRMENHTLCGDVNYDQVFPHVSAITPVPGGVGPMTIAMLMRNVIQSSLDI